MHSTLILALAAAVTNRANAQARLNLTVTNNCSDTLWPAVNSQAGSGPDAAGFELASKASRNLSVGLDWNGRIWGRTNCTFDRNGVGSCVTGDCGGALDCKLTGGPATLAEFNLPGWNNESFYDISLVDGYNLPLAIRALLVDPSNGPLPNQTNPSCVGSVQDLAPRDFDPYIAMASSQQQPLFLGTNASHPLPFETSLSHADVSSWCPYDLQQNPLHSIDGKGRCPCLAGTDVPHPGFNPCASACARYGDARFCCTGKHHDSAAKCTPNYYSRAAKRVCPDAYSYAFDDAQSTFAAPWGAGFEVVFCPGGRSTRILEAMAQKDGGLASSAGALAPRAVQVVSGVLTAAVGVMLVG